METNSTNGTNKLSAIDRALAAAQARKALKVNTDTDMASAPVVKPKVKDKPKVDSVDKVAEKAAKEALREASRLERAKEREERRAAKEADKANKGTAHMKKVARAASKLPQLSDPARTILDEISTNLGRVDQAALALHIQHFIRVKATEMSSGRRYQNGQRVRIVAGDLKYIGAIGTIESARPLRCFVNVPGAKKPIYVFTSELEPVEDAAVRTGTEG